MTKHARFMSVSRSYCICAVHVVLLVVKAPQAVRHIANILGGLHLFYHILAGSR